MLLSLSTLFLALNNSRLNFCFGFRATAISTQCLFLVLCSEIMSRRTQGTIWNIRGQIRVGCMCPIPEKALMLISNSGDQQEAR